MNWIEWYQELSTPGQYLFIFLIMVVFGIIVYISEKRKKDG